MRTFLRFLIFVLAGAVLQTSAIGQTLTTVTGTITDPSGLPYGGARLQPALVSPGGPSPSLTPCSSPVGCQIQNPSPVTLDGNGKFTINLWANASILPAGTTYSFTVLEPGVPPPFGTGPQTFTVTGITIAGASQSLTTTLSAAAPSLTLASSAAVAPNANAFYLSTNCGTQKNCYQTPANTQIVTDATFTSGSASVTTGATDPPFTANDVGKRAQATYACNVAASNVEKCAGVGCPDTTIASFVSAHSITLSANCINNSNNSAGVENRFAWGTPDDTAIASLTSAILAKRYGSISLPCTAMWTEQASFILNRGTNPSQGPISVLGCASGTVVVFGFNYNYATCVNGGGCFYDDTLTQNSNTLAYPGGNNTLRDVDIQGLGNSCVSCSFTNPVAAVDVRNTQTAENVHISGLNWNAPSNFDAFICQGGQIRNFFVNAGGRNAIRANPPSTEVCQITGFGFANNGNAAGLLIQSGIVESTQASYYADNTGNCDPTNGFQGEDGIVNNGGIFYSTQDVSTSFCSESGTSYLTDYRSEGPNQGMNISTGTNVHVKGVTFQGGAFSTFFVVGGNLFDDCGNVPAVATTIPFTGFTGNLFGSCSITGTVQTAANIVLGAGWGSTAAVSAVGGTDSLQQFTITAGGTGIAANPTVTITQPTHAWGAGFWAVPKCVIGPNQGNDIFADSVLGAVTASSVPFTWEATPTTGKTYIFTVSCSNP